MTQINLTIFRSVTRAYIESTDQQVTADWDSIIELLSEHTPATAKSDVLMFNMVKFKSLGSSSAELGRNRVFDKRGEWTGEYTYHANTVRRCQTNVESISGIVLDVDNNLTIEQTIEHLAGLEFFLYTTFNHSPSKHKFRVVIPFSQPLPVADIPGRQASIVETFPGVDRASFSVSQSFYLHSGNNSPYTFHSRGVIVDPFSFSVEEKVEPATPTHYPTTSEFDDTMAGKYKAAVHQSLLSCSGVRYRSDCQGGILMLVSICRSIGLEFNEFEAICCRVGDADSSIQDSAIRKGAWIGWTGNRVTREKRDRFISDHGGTPVQVVNDKREKIESKTHTLFDKYCCSSSSKKIENTVASTSNRLYNKYCRDSATGK